MASEARRRSKAAAMQRLRENGKPRALTAVRSCAEVAAIMNARGHKLSRSRVEQLEHRALAKLRALLADLTCDFEPPQHAENYATQQQVDGIRRRVLQSLEEVSCDG